MAAKKMDLLTAVELILEKHRVLDLVASSTVRLTDISNTWPIR